MYFTSICRYLENILSTFKLLSTLSCCVLILGYGNFECGLYIFQVFLLHCCNILLHDLHLILKLGT